MIFIYNPPSKFVYNKGLFKKIFEKKVVASGKEDLLIYDEWHPDIILFDICLSEMTGYQLLKAIRTAIEGNKTSIIMATGLSDSEDVMSCMKPGIEDYIVKPFSFQEIVATNLSYCAKKAGLKKMPGWRADEA